MAEVLTNPPLIRGEPLVQRPVRALLGWLNEAEAYQFLLGRQPTPADDVTALRQQWLAARLAVASRPPYSDTNVIVEMDDPTLVETIRARTEIQAAFPGQQWRPAYVELSQVVSLQKLIHLEGLEARVAEIQADSPALLELCLPTSQQLPPSGAIVDLDNKGLTLSSLNPNLRIMGNQLAEAQVSLAPGLPPMRAQAVTLFVSIGSSYLNLGWYQNRAILRDGYHRAAALLQAGISRVPCLVIEVRSLEELGCPPGAVAYDVLFGERPPTLSDFWDETVTCEVMRPAIRKVLRIRGDEFVVPL
jgi:hypothetical protein